MFGPGGRDDRIGSGARGGLWLDWRDGRIGSRLRRGLWLGFGLRVDLQRRIRDHGGLRRLGGRIRDRHRFLPGQFRRSRLFRARPFRVGRIVSIGLRRLIGR
ncbi:hypothetical protein LX81_02591 [Palleronia aestuarii]|uniref:Uncharacterized protein n=1 Tax=Palleronia aestuarii TaxID=568105 RepID=A0A2W7N5G6_9RHOB|nr:hypothetical protein [Palleronia aestuarii]PZX15288.1 hypothetical protein LX81_02591 [Palleronia aestuarii]